MKKQIALSFAIIVALLLAACGDTVENVNQMGMDVVASEDDLPKCTKDNEGELAFVKDDDATRVCVSGKWKPATPGNSMTDDFSCKTVELEDKSGLKIVCNGDSIGVVLNGADGKQGEAGKDGDAGTGCEITDRNDTAVVVKCGEASMTIDLNIGLPNDTAEADSERTPISLDSLVGFTQKGPFLKGSTVYLYELSDGRTLKQTNGNFTSNITRDDGRYKFTARDLVSQYAMVVVDGYYRNEVTGKSSNAPIRLKAITDMRKRSSVNVNILTHLEFERVYHLVTRGDSTGKKLTVKQAKRQAQREILSEFLISFEGDTDAEDMDVFGKSDADAALLAISILLQGNRTESEMMALLSDISTDIAEDGKWNGPQADSIKVQLADWVFGQDMRKFRKNVTDWHLSENDSVGDFEKFLVNYISTYYDIEPCGKPSTDKQTIHNELSIFNGKSYECFEWENQVTWIDRRSTEYLNDTISYGQIVDWRNRRLYNTVSIAKYIGGPYYRRTWMAENMDFDYRVNGEIYGTSCYNDSCDKYGKYGRLYTWAAAMDSAGLYSADGIDCGKGTLCNTSTFVSGICPEGWSIPSVAEWDSLIVALKYFARNTYKDTKDSTNLPLVFKSKSGWTDYYGFVNGDDLFGLSALPGGAWNKNEDDVFAYQGEGVLADFWSSTKDNLLYAYDVWIHGNAVVRASNQKEARLSVRCYKD